MSICALLQDVLVPAVEEEPQEQATNTTLTTPELFSLLGCLGLGRLGMPHHYQCNAMTHHELS